MEPGTKADVPMLRSGTIMLVVLLAAAVFYNLPGAISETLQQPSEGVAGWFLALGTLAAYFCGYKALEKVERGEGRGESQGAERLRAPLSPLPSMIRFAIVFCLLALLIPPFFSMDVYYYGSAGWQQAAYHANPYVSPLSEIPHWKSDPMFFPEWKDVLSPYGFLFSEISCVFAWLGGDSRVLTTLLFKLLNAAVFGATAWLVWRGCRYFGEEGERGEQEAERGNATPRRPLPAPLSLLPLYLFLWNPLLLLHFLSDGHNDLLMGFCTAACIFCAVAGKDARWAGSSRRPIQPSSFVLHHLPILAVPLLMIGVSVKQSSIIVLPFVLFYLAKRYGPRKAAIGLVVGIGLWAALAAPYLLHDGGRISLERIFKASFRSCPQTLAGFIFFPYQLASRLSPALMAFRPRVISAIGLVLALGFVAFYLRLLVLHLRGPYGPAKLLYNSVLVQFVLVCFVSVKFYPWYLGMFLPLAYWLPRDDKLRRVVLAVSCARCSSSRPSAE